MGRMTHISYIYIFFFFYPQSTKEKGHPIICHDSGCGGLEVACWPLVPKFAGSNPAEAVGFFRAKNPQHAFLRRGSKAVGLMS